jgi:hypothetical protein
MSCDAACRKFLFRRSKSQGAEGDRLAGRREAHKGHHCCTSDPVRCVHQACQTRTCFRVSSIIERCGLGHIMRGRETRHDTGWYWTFNFTCVPSRKNLHSSLRSSWLELTFVAYRNLDLNTCLCGLESTFYYRGYYENYPIVITVPMTFLWRKE